MKAQATTRAFVPSVFLASCLLLGGGPAHAQERPSPIIEAFAGYADFVGDPETLRHVLIGAGARVFVVPRLAVGGEATFMRGPDRDRDLFITGVGSVDLLEEPASPRRGLVPYLVASAGWFRHRDRFIEGLWSNEGTFTGGAGVRITVAEGLFIAPEVRFGTEPRIRFSVAIGTR